MNGAHLKRRFMLIYTIQSRDQKKNETELPDLCSAN